MTFLNIKEKFEDWLYDTRTWRRKFKARVLAPFRFLKNVWLFRKELWRFRRWDYNFNNRLYIRSWELTAELMESEDCLTSEGPQEAVNIRKFIKALRLSEDGIPEAERIMGEDFLELSRRADGNDDPCSANWMSNPSDTWNDDQKKFQEMMGLIYQIEERNWKNSWKLMSRKGRRWWE